MRLSIVIAAWNDPPSLMRCLQSLEGQSSDSEILAVTNFEWDRGATIGREFPGVRQIAMPAGTTVPILRAEGIRQACGEIVALAEDHCTFAANWCSELVKAHELAYSVIGGAVENGSTHRALDWAVYFYDYGRFMLPLPAGPAPTLSGNNVSYKRPALLEVESFFRTGLFEPFTHAELSRRGHPLYLAPAVVVYHQKEYRAGEAMAQAYHQARSFAAKRLRGAGLLKRAIFGVGSLILPLLLPGRIVVRTLRKRRLVAELLWCLPCVVILTTIWSLGEFWGYLAGAGSSAKEWK